MKWPEVVEALVAEASADAALLTHLGGQPAIYPSDDPRAGSTRSVGYTVITDAEDENFEVIRIQWDIFGAEDEAVAIERRLRQLVTSRQPVNLRGVPMWMSFFGGNSHSWPEGRIVHRSFDALYSPLYEGT